LIRGAVISALASAVAAGGVLSGVVVDDNGTPIANARVIYSSIPPATLSAGGRALPIGPAVGGTVRTASDGTFNVSGLPASKYHLCAYGPRNTDLGSCEWGTGSTNVDLASIQPALRFHISTGTLLTFQVNDPHHRIKDLADLRTPDGRMPLTGGNFAIGIWAGTRYAVAQLVSTNGAGRQYQLAIPRNASVRLFLDTPFTVVDGNGSSISVGRPSTTIAAAGQAAITISLTVQ